MPTPLNSTVEVKRQAPTPYSFSRPYWEGTREKKLLVQYCPRSGQYQFYPRPVSIATGHRDLEWREVSGAGDLFVHNNPSRARALSRPRAIHRGDGDARRGSEPSCQHRRMRRGRDSDRNESGALLVAATKRYAPAHVQAKALAVLCLARR